MCFFLIFYYLFIDTKRLICAKRCTIMLVLLNKTFVTTKTFNFTTKQNFIIEYNVRNHNNIHSETLLQIHSGAFKQRRLEGLRSKLALLFSNFLLPLQR